MFVCTDLDQEVRVEDHQISGHLSRDFNLLGLQLRVHAEQYVMGITVVPCGRHMQKQTKNTETLFVIICVFECHRVIFAGGPVSPFCVFVTVL